MSKILPILLVFGLAACVSDTVADLQANTPVRMTVNKPYEALYREAYTLAHNCPQGLIRTRGQLFPDARRGEIVASLVTPYATTQQIAINIEPKDEASSDVTIWTATHANQIRLASVSKGWIEGRADCL